MHRIFIFVILLFIGLGLKAQFSVGVRQGYGYHGLRLAPNSIEKYQEPFLRLNTGLVIIYNSINNAGLQMEINYAEKGWQEIDTTVAGAYFKRNVYYLEVPIFSHFEIDLGKIRPIIFVGPYLAWKLGESTDSENFTHIWNESHPYNHYEQEIRNLDFGIKLGLGVRYNITQRFAIYIDGRYDFEMGGGRDIFIDHPNNIEISRLKEMSGTFGILWHIVPQETTQNKYIYTPKEDLY